MPVLLCTCTCSYFLCNTYKLKDEHFIKRTRCTHSTVDDGFRFCAKFYKAFVHREDAPC
jgi:hypothetical protein